MELKTRSLNCRIGVMVILMEMHVEYKWKWYCTNVKENVCKITGLLDAQILYFFFLVIKFLRDYIHEMYTFVAVVFQLLSHVPLFATCRIIGPSPSSTIFRSLFKFMSTESVMLSNHLIHCHPLLFLPSIFPASGSFPVSWLHIKWPMYWSFSFSNIPSNE